MAGYVVTMSSKESIEECFHKGCYGTFMKIKKVNYWRPNQEGTFADYATMKEGDHIYFFYKRTIYGIGKITNIKGQCVYLNYPSANKTIPDEQDIGRAILGNGTAEDLNVRLITFFQQSPLFFKEGVDMDDVLSSNPKAFKMLRALWKLSFIKVDDEEDKALYDIMLRRNKHNYKNKFIYKLESHKIFEEKIDKQYEFEACDFITYDNDTKAINHEMALELILLSQLKNDAYTKKIFGNFDYLSHQVIASPFKPIDYMDKMDIFGYSYIPSEKYDNNLDYKTIDTYKVIELKRYGAEVDVVNQIMNYVDFIRDEYAAGDYDQIKAFIVANSISDEVIARKNEIGKRYYTIDKRPPKSNIWDNLTLIEYKYDATLGKITFQVK